MVISILQCLIYDRRYVLLKDIEIRSIYNATQVQISTAVLGCVPQIREAAAFAAGAGTGLQQDTKLLTG